MPSSWKSNAELRKEQRAKEYFQSLKMGDNVLLALYVRKPPKEYIVREITQKGGEVVKISLALTKDTEDDSCWRLLKPSGLSILVIPKTFKPLSESSSTPSSEPPSPPPYVSDDEKDEEMPDRARRKKKQRDTSDGKPQKRKKPAGESESDNDTQHPNIPTFGAPPPPSCKSANDKDQIPGITGPPSSKKRRMNEMKQKYKAKRDSSKAVIRKPGR